MSTPRYRQIIYRFPLLVFLVTSLVLSVLLRVGEPRIVGIVFGSLFLIAVFGVPLLAIAFCVFDITKFLQAPRIFRRPEAEVQIKVDIPDELPTEDVTPRRGRDGWSWCRAEAC
jgi:hypothetical protein